MVPNRYISCADFPLIDTETNHCSACCEDMDMGYHDCGDDRGIVYRDKKVEVEIETCCGECFDVACNLTESQLIEILERKDNEI